MPLPDAVLHPKSGPTNRPGLPSLGWAFLRTGAFAFGGLGATLALLQRDLVDRRGWLRASDVSEALAYTNRYPAIAANAFVEAFPEPGAGLDICPTEELELREGWPALAGDYHVVRYRAPVAVCALKPIAGSNHDIEIHDMHQALRHTSLRG